MNVFHPHIATAGEWCVRVECFRDYGLSHCHYPPQINHIYDVCMLCHSQCVQADKYIPDHKCNHDYYGRRKQSQQVARQCSIDAYVLKSVSWTMNPRISFSFSYRYCLSMQNEDDELTLRVSNITMACGTYVCFHTNRYFFALVLTSHTLCQPILVLMISFILYDTSVSQTRALPARLPCHNKCRLHHLLHIACA